MGRFIWQPRADAPVGEGSKDESSLKCCPLGKKNLAGNENERKRQYEIRAHRFLKT